MAPSLKDTAKQGFNDNQMQHCPPRSSVMFRVRSSSDSHAARGSEMPVCLSRTIKVLQSIHKYVLNLAASLVLWHSPNIWFCISANDISISDLRIIQGTMG